MLDMLDTCPTLCAKNEGYPQSYPHLWIVKPLVKQTSLIFTRTRRESKAQSGLDMSNVQRYRRVTSLEWLVQ